MHIHVHAVCPQYLFHAQIGCVSHQHLGLSVTGLPASLMSELCKSSLGSSSSWWAAVLADTAGRWSVGRIQHTWDASGEKNKKDIFKGEGNDWIIVSKVTILIFKDTYSMFYRKKCQHLWELWELALQWPSQALVALGKAAVLLAHMLEDLATNRTLGSWKGRGQKNRCYTVIRRRLPWFEVL